MILEKKNFKRGQRVKVDKVDIFGKKWTETSKVKSINNGIMLLENGDTFFVF